MESGRNITVQQGGWYSQNESNSSLAQLQPQDLTTNCSTEPLEGLHGWQLPCSLLNMCNCHIWNSGTFIFKRKIPSFWAHSGLGSTPEQPSYSGWFCIRIALLQNNLTFGSNSQKPGLLRIWWLGVGTEF